MTNAVTPAKSSDLSLYRGALELLRDDLAAGRILPQWAETGRTNLLAQVSARMGIRVARELSEAVPFAA